jgi:hypothetical protein
MLGFGDWGVTAAYVACLAATLLCIVSALRHWNDSDEDERGAARRQQRKAGAGVEEEI